MKDQSLNLNAMHCSIKIKNCAIWQNTFYWGGGGTVGGEGQSKNLMSLGVRKKMSQVRKIPPPPPPPRDFINERSLMSVQYTGGCAVHLGDIISTSGDVQYTGGIP